MDFSPAAGGTEAAAATSDGVDTPAADAAVTFALAVAASAVHVEAALVAQAAAPRQDRIIMPRVAPGGSGGSGGTTESGGSGLPTTVEGIRGGSGSKFDYMIFLYSGAAACTADAVAFPFDTAKTRSVSQIRFRFWSLP